MILHQDGTYLIVRIINDGDGIVYLWSTTIQGQPKVSEPRIASRDAFENFIESVGVTHLKRGNPSGDALD